MCESLELGIRCSASHLFQLTFLSSRLSRRFRLLIGRITLLIAASASPSLRLSLRWGLSLSRLRLCRSVCIEGLGHFRPPSDFDQVHPELVAKNDLCAIEQSRKGARIVRDDLQISDHPTYTREEMADSLALTITSRLRG